MDSIICIINTSIEGLTLIIPSPTMVKQLGPRSDAELLDVFPRSKLSDAHLKHFLKQIGASETMKVD